MLLGAVYQAHKELDKAEAAYLKAIRIAPALVQAHRDLAQVYAITNRPDKALIELNQVIKRDPKDVNALMLSGILHQRMNDIGGARETYEKVLALSPGFAQAANNLAYIYSEYYGDMNSALGMARIAREHAPNDPAVADTLGWVLYKQKEPQAALRYLKESAAKLPDNPEVQYHLGMTQYKLGHHDEARQILSRILEKGVEFKGVAEARLVLEEIVRKSQSTESQKERR